jgi:hypothetical protein
MLGRLKRTLKRKCPDCGRPLQLRSFGVHIVNEQRIFDDEIIICSICCGYEEKVVPEKKRKKREREEDI